MREVAVFWLLLTLPATGGVQAATHGPSEHVPHFAVGNTTRFIHDPSRGYDEAAGVTAGIRTLITEAWYPADPEAVQPGRETPSAGETASGTMTPPFAVPPTAAPFRRATYGDYVFGNRTVHRFAAGPDCRDSS